MPKSKRRPTFVAMCLCVGGLLCIAGSALAVENIRNESWRVPSTIGRQETLGGVQFDADLTPLDVLYGVEFSIMLQSRNRGPQVLLTYRAGAEQLPPAGTRLQINVGFLITCDGTQSRLYAAKGDLLRIFAQGRDRMEELRVSENHLGRGVATIDRGGGLAVGDEYAVPGQNPMALNGLVCATPANELPTPGGDGTIGVYFDAAGTRCQGTIQPGTPGTVYILVRTAGATADGIAGAEFKFTGLPHSWRVFPVANPELLAMGDPFGVGVVAGLPCQSPQAGLVLLYTVEVVADAEEPDVQLSIDAREPPLNRAFACPLLVACDEPAFTKQCVGAQSCSVNSTASVARPCATPTSVSPKTWTGVKELYR
jgi:hypothetical protein